MVDSSVTPFQAFVGHVFPDMAGDGSFVLTISIPAEAGAGAWRFTGSCSISDIGGNFSTADFTVTDSAGAPLTIESTPQPARTGEVLHVAGEGCVVDGLPLRQVVVNVYELAVASHARVEIEADELGRWAADLTLPSDMPHTEMRLSAHCRSTGARSPSWIRKVEVSLDVVQGTPPTSTTPTTPSTTQPTVLARTGAVSNTATAATGVLLVGAGIVLVVAARRRRTAAS